MKKSLRRTMSIVSYRTAIVVSLALISTHLCLQFGIKADFPLTLIATAVIFPIVFSIGGAYKRREAALDQYGAMKAHGSAIFYAARDWPENPSPECTEKIRKELVTLLAACRTLFIGRQREMAKHEPAVYDSFSRLSGLSELSFAKMA